MPEVKLDGLIEKIKREGVLAANQAAQEIETAAKEQAKEIIAAAEAEAQSILSRAKQESDKLKANAASALNQTARDFVLTVKEEITKVFDGILKQQVKEVLTPEFLKEIILKIVDKWSPSGQIPLDFMLSEQDHQQLTGLIVSHFKKKLSETIEIKPNSNFDQGFYIGLKGQDVYYDFSDESLLEIFKSFLKPSLAAMLTG